MLLSGAEWSSSLHHAFTGRAAHLLSPGFSALESSTHAWLSRAAAAAGQVASWYDLDDYVVTADALTGTSLIAGIFLNAITKGQYGWIQTAGLATVKFRASITKATPAIGDLVLVQATNYVGEVLADATNLTSVEARMILGVAVAAPTGGGSSLVALWAQYENI